MAHLLLPDSSFYITALRTGRDPLREVSIAADDYDIATCGMVVLEVTRGRSDPHILRRFHDTFDLMVNLPTTSQIWERAQQLAWPLDRRGIVLPAQDILIAAHALEADATLLTHDAHFQHIPGLRVVERLT